MRKLASLTLSLFLMPGMVFADSPKDSPKDAPKEAAAPAKTAATNATTKTNAEIAAEMEELRQALQAQQEQLQMLKEELAKRDKEIEEAREAAAAANSHAAEASAKATEAVATSTEVKTTTTELNSTVASMAASSAASSAAAPNAAALATSGAGADEDKGPATIRFKGVNLTPGGFIEAATISRQRGLSSDINTPFNSIPYADNSTGRLSETNFSARQSRLWLLVDTKIGSAKMSGYYEGDFLGAGTTSNNRQSNSYVFRQRQLWGRADFENGWAFSGGQMWSLATENKTGIVNRGEWFPQMIDPQYLVGFVWQRADALRVSKSFGDKLTLAASMEGSQATATAHGNSTYTSATGAVNTNSFVFAPGANGGLYNAFDTTGYSPNKLPDFVFKAALDPGWGHYEIFAIVSDFRDRVYPCAVVSVAATSTPTPVTYTSPDGTVYTSTPFSSTVLSGPALTGNPGAACTNTTPSAASAYNESHADGGGGFHAHVPVLHKKVDVGLTGLYGVGIGRFISAQLADATIRPDGSLAPLHNGGWLSSIDWHVTPKWDVYGYVGGEYASRAGYTGYLTATGSTATVPLTFTTAAPVAPNDPAFIVLNETQTTWKTSDTAAGGYGYPTANNSGCSKELPPGGVSTPGTGSGCTGDTRYISEATIGFWNRIYQGEKGRVQWGVQYSYFYRNAWSGVAGSVSGQPHAVDNMVWTSFRYYIP